MLTEIYIEALLVNEELADQVWKAWDAGAIDGVKVNSGVSEVSSSGNLIDLRHFNSIFKFDSGYQFGEVVESA